MLSFFILSHRVLLPPVMLGLMFLSSNCFHHKSALGRTAWTEDSFEDFVDGEFMDAGSNLYVSKSGRIQLINRWDFNGDGHLDILIPSGHAQSEKEDTFIYYNNGHGDLDSRTLEKIPTRGAVDGEIADLNKDGHNDLVVCNFDDGVTSVNDTFIYYGDDSGGFSANRRTTLPSISATRVYAEDFNGDGWRDLCVICLWQEDYYANVGTPSSLIYWNSPEGFDTANRSLIDTDGRFVEASDSHDLNGDGLSDLLCSRGDQVYFLRGTRNPEGVMALELSTRLESSISFLDVAEDPADGKLVVAFATRAGVSIHPWMDGALGEEFEALNYTEIVGLAFADLNRDNLLDLALARARGAEGAQWVDSIVLQRKGASFERAEKTLLPTMGAKFVTAKDLNGDSYPELVFSNYNVTNQHDIPSPVYWNREGLFHPAAVTFLETSGSRGNDCGDLNGDGAVDVVFFNLEGGFRDGASYSQVYWGDGSRNFGEHRSLKIPSHYMNSCAQADLDDDGYVDLLLAQERFISGADERAFNPLVIHWGGPDGFRAKSNLAVDWMGGGVRVVDIDRDGYLDVMVGGASHEWPSPEEKGGTIFRGGPGGFSIQNRTFFSTSGKEAYRVPLLADFDKDGLADAAYQVENGTLTLRYGSGGGEPWFDSATVEIRIDDGSFFGYINCADFNNDGWLDLLLPVRKNGRTVETPSFVIHGGPDGFKGDRIIALPGNACTDPSVADLDKDGYLDIVLHSYKSNQIRNAPTLIYYGSESGFRNSEPVPLPSWGAGGVETADYDEDGWVDVLLANHCRDGSLDVPGPSTSNLESFLSLQR